MVKLEISDVWNNNGSFIITGDSVRKFNGVFDLEDRYKKDEEVLHHVVPNLIKIGSSLSDIYQVVTLINSFYSTRMGADICYKMAFVLHENNNEIIEAINNKDISGAQRIIEIFRKKTVGRKDGKLEPDQFTGVNFSFLTKYFSILSIYNKKKDAFPIYDGVVARLLTYQTGKSVTQYGADKKYDAYVGKINELITGTNLKYKELDNYLWNIGRKIEDLMQQDGDAKSKVISSKTTPNEIRKNLNTIISNINGR